MALTPVEIRHLKPAKTLVRGYKRVVIDDLLDEIAVSFEDVWRERADLADKIEQLEEDLVRYRELESLLRTTLVSAERASQELKEQARREASRCLRCDLAYLCPSIQVVGSEHVTARPILPVIQS